MEEITGERPIRSWLLAIAVGLAFADASIVVLALPRIYSEFDTTIVGVSWVLTGYAAVVAVAALAIAATHRHLKPITITTAGLVTFAAASVLCGVADTFAWLMAGRCLQGVGAALLLAGALVLLTAMWPAGHGRTVWSQAAAIGLAVGPALGGVLTELFDWRSIFLAQAPVAVAALFALADRRVHAAEDHAPALEHPRLLPHVGLVFLLAGLVGALFLSVLLVIEIWRFSPMAGAAVVTALPAGMLVTRPLSARLARSVAVVGGALLLSGGLAGIALLPAASPALAGSALAVCGAGLALLSGVFDPAAIGSHGGLVRDGSLAVSARHAGLVLGLLVIAPVLAASLDTATERAVLAGTATVLDAKAPIDDKVRIALAVRDQLADSPRGEVPDLTATVAAAGVDDESADLVGGGLADAVRAVLTRAFRPAFLAAAALGLGTVVPGLLLARRRVGGVQEPRARRTPLLVLSGLALATSGLLVAEAASDASSYGSVTETDGCTAPADAYPGDGFDAAVQRIAHSAVNGAACELEISRERLLLALDGQARFGAPRLDEARLEDALEAGLIRAIDDADERGSTPGWTAAPLRWIAEHAPLQWIVDRIDLPG